MGLGCRRGALIACIVPQVIAQPHNMPYQITTKESYCNAQDTSNGHRHWIVISLLVRNDQSGETRRDPWPLTVSTLVQIAVYDYLIARQQKFFSIRRLHVSTPSPVSAGRSFCVEKQHVAPQAAGPVRPAAGPVTTRLTRIWESRPRRRSAGGWADLLLIRTRSVCVPRQLGRSPRREHPSAPRGRCR